MHVRECFRLNSLVIQDIIEDIEQIFVAGQSWFYGGIVNIIWKLAMQIFKNIDGGVERSLKFVRYACKEFQAILSDRF